MLGAQALAELPQLFVHTHLHGRQQRLGGISLLGGLDVGGVRSLDVGGQRSERLLVRIDGCLQLHLLLLGLGPTLKALLQQV